MTRIGIITDAHANLPALRAAFDAFSRAGVDAIYHTGDAVGYGPNPEAVVETLLSVPNGRLLIGNHDRDLVDSRDEQAGPSTGFNWFHSNMPPALVEDVAAWPYLLREEFEEVRVAFLHYGLDATGTGWVGGGAPGAADMDAMFAPYGTQAVFFGHSHAAADFQGRTRAVNPGALGLAPVPVARYAILEVKGSQFRVEHGGAPYDPSGLLEEFKARDVPGWRGLAVLFYPFL